VNQRFDYRELEVYVWTVEFAKGHDLWLYTIDDRYLAAGGRNFEDEASALDAGLMAARRQVDSLVAQGVRPTKNTAGIRQREVPAADEDLAANISSPD